MSTKHTQGPWRVADYMARAELIEGPNGEQLAMRQDDASVADMFVMAAARDLLEALVSARNLIELAVPFEGAVTRQIDKAIAKATGEQP